MRFLMLAAAVLMNVMGDLTGRTLVLIHKPSALVLCDILFRRAPGSTQELGPMEESGIKEAGNILASAYLNALSDFMGMMLIPSVPSLAVDVVAAVLTTAYLNFGHHRDYVFCVVTSLRVVGATDPLQGHLLMLPDIPSLREVWGAAATYVPCRDSAALADTVNRLARDPERLRAAADAAQQRARQFSAARMAARYMDVYRTIMSRAAALKGALTCVS